MTLCIPTTAILIETNKQTPHLTFQIKSSSTANNFNTTLERFTLVNITRTTHVFCVTQSNSTVSTQFSQQYTKNTITFFFHFNFYILNGCGTFLIFAKGNCKSKINVWCGCRNCWLEISLYVVSADSMAWQDTMQFTTNVSLLGNFSWWW